MERRYEIRLRELLDEAVVSPEQVRGLRRIYREDALAHASGWF